MKLVRVVLFLNWRDREVWKPCLEKAAKDTEVTINGELFPLGAASK